CHQHSGPNGWFSLISFSHDPTPASCTVCHDHKRPMEPHPQGTDCKNCHTFGVWKDVANFNHPDNLSSCNLCHDDGSSAFAIQKRGRPAAPHPQGGRDCIDCHTASFPMTWANRITLYDHLPKPTNCSNCHDGVDAGAQTSNRGRPATPHTQTGNCADCHTFNNWNVVITVDHSDPDNINSDCNSCHSAQKPVAPHPTSNECKTCHSFPAWNQLKQYNHDPTPTTCKGCHDGQNPLSLNQKGRPPIPHPQGGTDCNQCHTYPLWKPVIAFNHLPEPESCASCHTGTNATLPKLGRPTRVTHPQLGDCKGCHTYDNWADANPTSYNHLPTPTSCAGCHETETRLDRPALPHPATGECITCHQFPSWTPATQFSHDPKPVSCNGCHEGKSPLADKQKGRPIAPHPQGQRDCIDCHDFPSWGPPITFDHLPTPTSCNACHNDRSPFAFKQKGRPALPHPQTRDCIDCHAFNTWTPTTFDHNPNPTTCTACHANRSALDLKQKGPPGGSHPLNRDCNECHTYNNWTERTVPFDHQPAPQTCISCHVTNNLIQQVLPKLGRTLRTDTGVNHSLVTNCASCHTFNSWTNVATYTHDNPPPTECTSCHETNNASPLTTPKLGRPTRPEHPAAGDCINCHTFSNWSNVTSFDHVGVNNCNECHNDNSQAAMVNRGRPALPHPGNDRDCKDCHTYNSWKPPVSYDHNPLPETCNDCHNSQSPLAVKQKGRPFAPHPQGNRDCVDCHTYDSWKPPVTFDHDPTPASCNSCHDQGQLASAPKQKGRPAAPHPQGGRDCISCHSTSTWTPPQSYDHIPLSTDCFNCHVTNNAAPNALPKLGKPTRPTHTTSNACNTCHVYTGGWSNISNFNHTGATSCNICHESARPLTPHPQTTDCATCHTNPSWVPASTPFNHTPTPESCRGCHENGTRQDRPILPHPQAGECNNCHSTTAFEPVVQYTHNPEPATCQNCHTGVDVGGNKRGRPTTPHPQSGDCNACHQYATDSWLPLKAFTHLPLPNSCNGCHSGDRPASGDHNYPNESTGNNKPNPTGYNAADPTSPGTRHYVGNNQSGEEMDCAKCHRTPAQSGQNTWNNFRHNTPRARSCLPCHYVRKDPDGNDTETWDKHSGNRRGASMRGFGNCYNCHDRGKSWDE
ncbi:MAG: hypothetical protein HN576_01785, partial [Bacteriovoracaceae bacterium]|nr:hypothetical protein [Bacteriovoracaceae bacterium]